MQGATFHDPYANAGAHTPRVRATPLLSALFLLFTAVALLRVALNPLLLDLVVNYSTDAGSIVEKLHPSLYGFVLIALVALSCLRIVLDPYEVRVLRAVLAFNAGIVLILAATVLAGRGGSAGFLIDTYCGACLAILLFLFPPSWRVQVGHVLILWMALSALVAMVEFALKTRLQPFSETEAAFRPLGLTGHPLELGLWMAIGVPFTAATRWSRGVKLAVGAVFLAGLGVSGARTALVFGLAAAALTAIGAAGGSVSSGRRLERRVIVLTLLVALIPLGLAGLAAFGGLARFGGGVGDANAQARVSVYGIFEHMTWAQILFGMDPAAMLAIAKKYFKLEAIESSVVMFVALFGALGSVLFAALLAWLLRSLLAGARAGVLLGTAVFFVVVLSSNGLSGKGSAVFLLFTLIIALRPPPVAAAA